MGPVFRQVENDVDDLVWQISRECEMLAERYDGSHRRAFSQVKVWRLVGISIWIKISRDWGEGEDFASVFGGGYMDGIPLPSGAGHAVEHCAWMKRRW